MNEIKCYLQWKTFFLFFSIFVIWILNLPFLLKKESLGGVMVSMVAFQAADPGSIPGQDMFFFFKIAGYIFLLYNLIFFCSICIKDLSFG